MIEYCGAGKTRRETLHKMVMQLLAGELKEEMIRNGMNAEKRHGPNPTFMFFSGYAEGMSKAMELILTGQLTLIESKVELGEMEAGHEG